MVDWRGVERFAEIRVGKLGSWATGAVLVAQTDVPFSDDAGSVAVLQKKRRQSRSARLDHGVALGTKEHPVFHPIAPRIAPSHEPVTRHGAARGWSVCIGKTHAHRGETLHVGRVDLDVVRVAGEILECAGVADSHVIRHEQDDVRLRVVGKNRERKEANESGSKSHTLNRARFAPSETKNRTEMGKCPTQTQSELLLAARFERHAESHPGPNSSDLGELIAHLARSVAGSVE